MPSEKLLMIQEKNKERSENKAEADHKQAQLKALKDIKDTQIATMRGMAELIKGDTTKEEIIEAISQLYLPDGENVVTAVNAIAEIVKNKNIDFSPLQEWFDTAIEKLSIIAEKEVTIEKDDPIDLSTTNTILEGLQAVIEGKESIVNVAAPIVNLPKTKLVVEKVDLTELLEPLTKIFTAITNAPVPIIEYTDTSLIEEKLDKSNELLDKIAKKKTSSGGGGGGGNGTPYTDSNGVLKNVILQDGLNVPVTVIDNQLPTAGNNPIVKIHKNASGQLVKVEKIIGTTTYTKTTDVTDQAITSVTTYSVWS